MKISYRTSISILLVSLFLSSFVPLFAANLTINVDGASPIRTIPMTMYGTNLQSWDWHLDGTWTQLNNLLINTSSKYFRIPGGSWGNGLLWSDIEGPNGSQGWKISYEEYLSLMSILSQPGEEMYPTLQPIVNFPGWWYETLQDDTPGDDENQNYEIAHWNAVDAAVAWVQDQTSRAVCAEYWEIGNEIGGPWEVGYFPEISGTYYGDYFADFSLAMKAVNPNIKIGACAEPKHELQPWGWYQGYWTYDTLVAAAAKNAIPDFLIIHQYPGSGELASYNPTLLANRVNDIAQYTSNMDGIVQNALGPEYIGQIRYTMTEWDAGGHDNYDRVTCYVNAMFHAQYILEMAKNDWDVSTPWIPQYNEDTWSPYPVWYVHPLLINYFGRDMVDAASSNSIVRAYASFDFDGNLTLFIVNNSPTADLTADINIAGFSAESEGLLLMMEPAGSMISGGVNIQDLDDISINGIVHPNPLTLDTINWQVFTAGNSFELSLPRSSMVLLTIPENTVVIPDYTPPSPNPMGWTSKPAANSNSSIVMEATTASDISGVEYFFTCTYGSGHDSGWQLSTVYEDSGLTAGDTYTYTVTARDLSAEANETITSVPASAIPTSIDTPITVENYSFELPGTGKQTNWSTVPGWSSDTVASDSGVETGWSPTDGTYTGYLMGSDPSAWSLTGHTIAAGDIFELVFDSMNTSISTTIRASLYYNTAGGRVTAATEDFTISGSMQEYRLSFNSAAMPASVGNLIGIEFDNVSIGWLGLDNVRLYMSVGASDWLYGDFTGNHVVDFDDIAGFTELWLLEDCSSLADFDVNDDCIIGLAEFSQMAQNWMDSN